MPEDTTGNSHVTRSVEGPHVTIAWMPMPPDVPNLTKSPEHKIISHPTL